MKTTTIYRINTDRFAHETVDDEVIIIDMDEGNYFSMRGSAAAIWQLVDQDVPEADIIAILESATGADLQQIQSGVSTLLGQLAQEQILSGEPHSGEHTVTGINILLSSFESPAMEKFTEMQDLLTLDPIHEVDETGWPHRASHQTEDTPI